MTHINEIEGIGPSHAEKFESHGIKTVEDLLKAGATPNGREELIKKTGISHHLILKWVDEADLFRVKGIGRQYTEFLRAAGVDSVKELAQRRADHLHEKLTAINREKKHVHEVPSLNAIKRWIEEAKALPRMVSY
jgi:nucleotidyltransferase/DNA polymerase involved in DNA repair